MTRLLAGFALGAAVVYALMRRPRHWRSVLAELRGYVDAVDAQRGARWFRIDDVPPKPYTQVDVFCDGEVKRAAHTSTGIFVYHGERLTGVELWRPLPPGPDAHDPVAALLADMRRVIDEEVS